MKSAEGFLSFKKSIQFQIKCQVNFHKHIFALFLAVDSSLVINERPFDFLLTFWCFWLFCQNSSQHTLGTKHNIAVTLQISFPIIRINLSKTLCALFSSSWRFFWEVPLLAVLMRNISSNIFP